MPGAPAPFFPPEPETMALAPIKSISDYRPGLSHLMGLLRPELGALLLGSVFVLVSIAADLAYPQVLRVIIDGAVQEGLVEDLAFLALLMLGLVVVQGIFLGLLEGSFSTLGERIVASLRIRLFDRLLHQDLAFFDESLTGELSSRIFSDAERIQRTLGLDLGSAIRYLFYLVGGLALLIYTSARLTIYMAAVVPPVVLVVTLTSRRMRALSRETQGALAGASTVALESMAGIRTIRAFGRESLLGQLFRDRLGEYLKKARRRILTSAVVEGFSSITSKLFIVAAIWFGGVLIPRGEITLGELVVFLLYTTLVARGFERVGRYLFDAMGTSGSAERIFQILHRPLSASHVLPDPEAGGEGGLRPTGQGETLDTVQGFVTFEEVTFRYPSRPDVAVLRDINLKVEPAEIVALVGRSGSGKSTLVGLVPRLYEAQEGRVLLDGRELGSLDPFWLREQIGIVPQDPVLFSTSVAENIRFGKEDAGQKEVEAATRSANAHDFILGFPNGYETQVGERGVQLSGGQRQRIAIARAILRDPRILILDEAMSALDAESEALVQDALDRLMRGRTTLIVAHRLSTVARAHRVVVLEGGLLVQSGTHEELLQTPGPYRTLVDRQLRGV
ncbi:ABC transporter ATP-binding protein [Gemmatimonadota bacterium]